MSAVIPVRRPPAAPVKVQRASKVGETCGRVARAAGVWSGAHWLWVAAWAVIAAASTYFLGWRIGVVVVVSAVVFPALTVGVIRTAAPVFYQRVIAEPLIAVNHLIWWAIRYDNACEATKLGYRPIRQVVPTMEGRSYGQKGRNRAPRCLPIPSSRGLVLKMRVPRGMSVEEVETKIPAFAAAMRARSYGYHRVSARECTVRLTMVDVFGSVIVAPPPADDARPVVLGVDEGGTPVVFDPFEALHSAFQGMTRSGKSTLTYVLLSGLAARNDVVVVGCDPSGILLGPWRDGRGGPWIATGTRDLERHALVLEAIVREMDRRIGWLTDSQLDKLDQFDAEVPVLVVVLEEWPGLMTAANAADPDVARRIARAHGRLSKESAKAGIRLVTLAQRFSAKSVDTDDRSNYGLRGSLRVDNGDALRMLHDGSSLPSIGEVHEWPAGVGLIEQPGRPLMRWRAFLLDYRGYLARVRRGIARQHGVGGWTASPVEIPRVTVESVGDVIQGETVESPPRPRRQQPKQPRQPRQPRGRAA